MPDKLLTIEQAAVMLGVSRWWFYQNKRWQTLPFLVLLDGGTIRFSEQAILTYIATKLKENGNA
jgi:excisionase family DNA binding protein